MELDVGQARLLAPREAEAIVDSPNRELRILCDHDWLNVTWTRHAEGEHGAEPHVHHRHVDAFYVLAGDLTLRIGPELEHLAAPAGTLVMVPPGVVHGFDNDGPGEVRFLNFHAPGSGFVEHLRGRGDFDQHPPPPGGGRPGSGAIVVPPGDGERFRRENRTITILGALPEISVLRLETDPDWPGVPAHEHGDHVDTFFVLDGEAGFVLGDDVLRAAAGSFYAAPPGARHGFVNDGGRVTLLNVHGPDAGFADGVRRE